MSASRSLSRRELLCRTSMATVATMLAASGCGAGPTEAPTSQPATVAAQEEPTNVEPTSVPTATAAPQPTAVEPAKITIFVGFGVGGAPEQIEYHNKLAQEFGDTRKDILIEFLTVPNSERNTKFTAMLAGDMAPDICMPIGVGGVASYFDEWLDIKPFVERDKYDLSDFVGESVKVHTYPTKMIGLPMGVYPEAVYYNEDLFDAAGVDYPPHEFATGEWTYDRLVEIARKLTLDSSGNDADSSSFDPSKTVQWGWDGLTWAGIRDLVPKYGGNSYGVSDDLKTAMLNAPEWVAAAQWMSDNIWKWHIRASTEQSGVLMEATGDPLGSNKVAMWETLSWMNYAYSGWTDAFHWDIGAIPMGPVGKMVTDADADTFVIPGHSHHPEEAWEVAKWMSSPQVLPGLTHSWGCVPARTSSSEAWVAEATAQWPDHDWQVMADSLSYVGAPSTEAWTPEPQQLLDILTKAWDLIATGENTDAKVVLDQANGQYQAILDEYWAQR